LKNKNPQEKKECEERRRHFLQVVANKPLVIQIDKYFGVIAHGFQKVNEEFERYGVPNEKLSQILWLQKIHYEIITNFQSNSLSYEYSVDIKKDDPPDLSPNKIKQYKAALNRNPGDNWYQELIIRFYITTEWIMEDWAKRNNLDYIDYNETDSFSPQDCRVAGVDIDVKTTLSIGENYREMPYYTRNEQVVQNEVQVGISSSVSKSSDEISFHCIQGIFDPSIYNKIDLELKYLSVSSKLKNPCYFHPLKSYFLETHKYENFNYDEDVIEYWVKSHNLTAIFHSIGDSSVALKSLLEFQLKDFHYDLIPIILELVEKESIFLLPHYFADYLLSKIHNKQKIDTNLVDIVSSIFQLNEDQEIYIKNLFKLVKVLPKVTCKWHPEEGIKDMEIKFLDGHIPTFQVVCSHDPQKQTTIYSYSWKTGQTVIYSKEAVCPSTNCGGLTHKRKDYFSKQVEIFCKSSCITYGREAHNSNNSRESNEAFSLKEGSTDIKNILSVDFEDDVPF
jgi:hypothetical protein